MSARTQTVVTRWFSVLTLLAGLAAPASALASPVLYSTSGSFDLPSGTLALTGVTDAVPQDYFPIGSLAASNLSGDTPFHLHFAFNNGLPAIDVSGTIPSIGYNTDWAIKNPLVTTSATGADLALYPTAFQNLLANPSWLHSTSFSSPYYPTTGIMMSVHPEDPFEVRPVPEPSSLALFATVLAGLGWRARRRLSRPHGDPSVGA